MKGYHQCPREKNIQLPTTFITPRGKFKYLRAPYGIAFISEHYEWYMAEAFSSLTGLQCFVNDIAIYCSDLHQHASHVMQFLQQCTSKQIAYNFATLAGLK